MLSNLLRWIGRCLLGLGVLVVVLWLAARYGPLPAAQRAALAQLQAPLPPEGRNAFTAMYMLPYDQASAAQRQAVVEMDLRSAPRTRLEGAPPPFVSAAQAYPRQSLPSERCRPGCLAWVRAHAAQVEDGHRSHAALHQRIAALADAGHLRSPFVADPASPMPPFQYLFDRLPVHALAHVQGRTGEALQGVCTDVRTGRMLIAQGDTLMAAMLGAALVEHSTGLFAEMLAELPASHPVPAQCRIAFAAPAVEAISLCAPLHGEAAFLRRFLALSRTPGAWLLLDERRTLARAALPSAQSCSPARARLLAEDLPVPATPPPRRGWDCLANPIGCALVDIAPPTYTSQLRRAQDTGAALRLAGVLLWLREQPIRSGADLQAALQHVPAAVRSGQRPIQWQRDDHALQVARHAPAGLDVPADGAATFMRLPLPPLAAWEQP